MDYSPALGKSLVTADACIWKHTKSTFGDAACIAKLNDVYINGSIARVQVSPRKQYSSVVLSDLFTKPVSGFLESKKDDFKPSQIENAKRRCILFMKFVQHMGRREPRDITYDDVRLYHGELSHLKRISRVVEESTLHQFLLYLSETCCAGYGLHLYMHALETGSLATMDSLPEESRRRIGELRGESLSFPPEEFLSAGLGLMDHLKEAGYVSGYIETAKRAIHHLYLFLDLHGVGYSKEIADIWLNSEAVKGMIPGSSWKTARRTLSVFSRYASCGQADFSNVMQRGISGLTCLPEWCTEPLLNFAETRRRTKLDDDTVKNDIYSILRFCRFIVSKGLSSYDEVTGETIADFNLADIHGSPEGKNACNCRIRRFLKYLYRCGITHLPSLHMAVGCTAASVETIVVTLTEEERETIKSFVENACTDLEIRDSAVMMLGTEMGMRGGDIAGLRLRDIDWKNRSIRFLQEKTDTDAWIPMPVAVGNALFRYLSRSRPRKAGSDHVFVGFRAPYQKMTRCICYGALKRILPGRSVKGSGFHVTRKTFSTNRLRNGVHPDQIADAIGQRGTKSLVHYLSLDDERMSMCPLSLDDLGLVQEGGAQ